MVWNVTCGGCRRAGTMVNREIQQTGGASTETAQSRVSVWWMRMVMGVVRSFVRSSVRALCEAPERAEGNPACGKSGLSANVGNCVNWGGTTRGLGGGTRKKKGGARRHDDAGREKREIRSDASIFFFFSGSARAERRGRVIGASIDGYVDWSIDASVDRRGRVAPLFFLSLFLRWKISQCVSNGTRADERKRQKTERKETDRRAIAGRRTSWKRQRERC